MDNRYKLLNEIIDKDIIEMKKIEKLKNGDFIEIANRINAYYINKIKYQPRVRIIRKVTKEDVVKLVLEFYKNLDLKMYQKAINIIMGKDEDTKIVIYDNKTKEYLPDDDEFERFSNCARILEIYNRIDLPKNNKEHCFDNLRSKIYIPLKGDIRDIYDLTHEIAHTLDLKRENKPSHTRRIFSEITPACMELLLDDYLLNRGFLTEKELVERRTEKEYYIKKDSNMISTKIELAKIKFSNKKELDEDNIINYMKVEDSNISSKNTEKLLNCVLDFKGEILYRSKYVIANLISPYIYREYKKEKDINILYNYFEGIKDDDINKALNAVGLKLDEESIEKLKVEKNKYMEELQKSANKIDRMADVER